MIQREKKNIIGGKILAILLAVMLVIFSVPDIGMKGGVHAAGKSGSDDFNLTWTFNNGTLVIKKYNDEAWIGDKSFPNDTKESDYAWNSFRNDITKITIEEGVQCIGTNAFAGCKNLTTVELPQSLRFISDDAFYKCQKLSSIDLNLPNLQQIRSYAFSQCSSLGNITLPSSIKFILNHAFSESGVKKVKYYQPSNDMEKYVFYNCKSLTEVVIYDTPGKYFFDTVTEATFTGCSKLTKVTLPDDSFHRICRFAFDGCTELADINLAEVSSCEDYSFRGCKALKKLKISDGSCGKHVFDNCSSLWLEINAPTSYYVAAREEGYNFNLINGGRIGNNIIWYVSYYDNELVIDGTGVIPDYESVGPWYAKYRDKITKIKVSEGITRIGNNAFNGLNKAKAVSIGKSVKEIGDGAFAACSGIEELVLSEKTQKIGEGAFEDCSSIEKVSIPDTTTSIGDHAFNGCSNLTEANIPDSVVSIGKDAFRGTSKKFEIKTTDGSAAADYAAENAITCSSKTSKELKEEEEAAKKKEEEAKKKAEEESKKKAEETKKKNEESKKTDDKKTANKTPETTTTKTAPAKGAIITDGKFEYKVTKQGVVGKTVGTLILTKTKNKKIKAVSIGSTVKINGISYKITAIGNNTFNNCKKLSSLTVGANVTTIGEKAFSGCAKLKAIKIKSTKLKKVGANAFKGINKKATIKVPKSKKKAYTKLLKGKGQAKTVKIK